MTPLQGTRTSSAPVGDVPGGDKRAARATPFKVFHETRDTGLPGAPRKPARIPRFSRNTRHETRNTAFIAVCARGAAPPETSVRSTAPAGKSLFSSSPLFAVVHHCSPLFSKKILSRQVSAHRPAFWLGLTTGLHVSSRGEVKCVSRAEEKGARSRTCQIAFFTPRVTKHVLSGSTAIRHFS